MDTSRKRILVVFGTRPEALKCFPVVRRASADDGLDVQVCVTAQHREMLDSVIALTGMSVDYDLNLMKPGQSLFDTTSRVLTCMAEVLHAAKPDIVLVQGDTTTAMAAALAAFYKHIAVGHIEAGLRSGDTYSPWPEEMNRKIIGDIAALHFAPTAQASENLLKEGKPAERIFITGNTAIDTLLHFSREIDRNETLRGELASRFESLDRDRKLILVTGHRRENFGTGIQAICSALARLSTRDDVEIVYPVHPNPNVLNAVRGALDGVHNIHLIPPQDYLAFLYLMKRSYLVLTDSGGVQEEAPSLGKPVLVMRDNTERPEGIAAGTAILVGADSDRILAHAYRLLDSRDAYDDMSKRHNPYGDGAAAERIVGEVLRYA
jgi:UDP-N-acetylglucosamine 2-epimerase